MLQASADLRRLPFGRGHREKIHWVTGFAAIGAVEHDRLRSDGSDPVVVELEQVVSRGDEAPFRPHGESASSSELPKPAVLGVAEHRLDCLLSLAVDLVPMFAGEHATHDVIEPARRSRARVLFEA
jgi:hypothetical protein